jgi:hypothetical protein
MAYPICAQRHAEPALASSSMFYERARAPINIDELLSQAYFGDTVAINDLIGIAAGTGEPVGLQASAETELLDLYARPETPAHVRTQIAAQIHAFHETATLDARKPGVAAQLKLPFRLLYLAGRQEASKSGPTWLLEEIGRMFSGVVSKKENIAQPFQHALGERTCESETEILSPTRYVSFAEMAVRHDRLVAFGGKMPEATNAEVPDQFNLSVNSVANALLANNPSGPEAVALFVLVGNAHWIPMVFRREGDKVSGYVIDSSWFSGLVRHTRISEMVKTALGEKLDSFHYKYAEMQGLTNACGLLTTRFICWISHRLAADPNIDIPREIDVYVTEWKGYTNDQQEAYVAGMRAEKLAGVAEEVHGSRFAPKS